VTSPIGVIGLAFAGYDLQRADLNVMFAITEGLDDLPAVRGSDQVIPFRPGRLALPRLADRRAVVATGWVAGGQPAPESTYRTYLDGLKAVLDPTRPPDALVATLENGSVRWIIARPANILGGELVGHEMRPMSIEWEAVDPYWYGTFGSLTADAGYRADGGWAADSSREFVVVPPTEAYDFNLDVPGTAAARRIVARFDSPSIGICGLSNRTFADPIGFTSVPLPVGALPMVIDNEARTIVQGGTSYRKDLTLATGNEHGEYIRLLPGRNVLRVTGKPTRLRLTFYPAYQ
jgi:hypothetical protein